jgi:hypothetical protein
MRGAGVEASPAEDADGRVRLKPHPDPGHCITCSDEAVEAVVIAADGFEALVTAAGQEERVAIDLVPDASPGDVLLCHAGIALERTNS